MGHLPFLLKNINTYELKIDKIFKEANTGVKAPNSTKTGRWTREEHFRFIEALKLYGKEWRKV